jgi:hemolysin III
MQSRDTIFTFSPQEEKLNIISHAIGLLLSVVAFILLLQKSLASENLLMIVSFSVFGISLIILYAASTFYHNAKESLTRKRLNIFDHAAIYVLIAGTYTPFTLVTLQGNYGWLIFFISWTLALAGIILKLFFTGRFRILSTSAYVFMGWLIVFVIKPLVANLSDAGINWLFAGGISYTIGAVIYSIKRIKYNHAIFHVFVLIGSFCHFMSVYFHVIPKN